MNAAQIQYFTCRKMELQKKRGTGMKVKKIWWNNMMKEAKRKEQMIIKNEQEVSKRKTILNIEF